MSHDALHLANAYSPSNRLQMQDIVLEVLSFCRVQVHKEGLKTAAFDVRAY